jgi:hypothetical protein
MDLRLAFPLVDEILHAHSDALGAHAGPYRHHVYRALHYYLALAGIDGDAPDSVLVAAAFHDIGIWTDRTFDYLPPSARRAGEYLAARDLDALVPEVTTVIEEHHKLRAYRGAFASAELFRRADLVDVSTGVVRFGLPAAFVRDVKAAFPDDGFHRYLVSLAARQLVKHPFRPLPMVRW